VKSISAACISRLALITIVLLSAQVARAEIYKWVDANGKVHFGDKPTDAAQAEQAKPVTLSESYRPAERTAEEQARDEQEQLAIKRRNALRQQEEQEALAKAQKERSEEKSKRCGALQERIETLSTVEVKDGRRTFHYATDKDGNAVSSDRQKEIVEELKAKLAAEGCA